MFVRLTPIFVVMPIFAFARIPMLPRIILSFALALIIATAAGHTAALSLTITSIISEFLLGMLIALSFHVAYAALDTIGKLIDLQMGFSAVGVFDPSSSNITGLISEFLVLIFAVLFFILDLHHVLLRGLIALLTVYPIGQVSFEQLSVTLLFKLMSQQFLMAFMILAPVIVVLWLSDLVFAVMSRSMPQANIYFMSLPFKIAIGIFVLMLSLPLIVQYIPSLYDAPLNFKLLQHG